MLRRRWPTVLLVTLGTVAGSVLYRRRSARRFERVELYAEDGSMTSLAEGSADGARMLSLARGLIAFTG
jgi:UPF0716 family protein affecting phage T7 exclusion